jgi:hypothetical protein
VDKVHRSDPIQRRKFPQQLPRSGREALDRDAGLARRLGLPAGRVDPVPRKLVEHLDKERFGRASIGLALALQDLFRLRMVAIRNLLHRIALDVVLGRCGEGGEPPNENRQDDWSIVHGVRFSGPHGRTGMAKYGIRASEFVIPSCLGIWVFRHCPHFELVRIPG